MSEVLARHPFTHPTNYTQNFLDLEQQDRLEWSCDAQNSPDKYLFLTWNQK